MLKNIQTLSLPQRRFVFFVIFGGGLLAFVGIAVLLINSALNTGQRVLSVALDPSISVIHDYAALPGNYAYPPALVVLPDQTIYTGSYSTGTMYVISPSAEVSELPGTADAIGAFTGITRAPDGSLIVIDQNDTDPRTTGGKLWKIVPDSGEISEFVTSIDTTGWIAPNDLTFDSAGRLYVTDPGRNEVWRFEPDGSGGTIWFVPPQPAPDAINTRRAVTGIAYDMTTDSILVTDPEQNIIYRVNVSDGVYTVIYEHGAQPNPPGFDGLTVTPDGTIYAAALGQNGIARVEADGTLVYIAGLFRGASDVDYAAPGLLYVSNFDQASIVLPVVAPQLPFAIDKIDLNTPTP